MAETKDSQATSIAKWCDENGRLLYDIIACRYIYDEVEPENFPKCIEKTLEEVKNEINAFNARKVEICFPEGYSSQDKAMRAMSAGQSVEWKDKAAVISYKLQIVLRELKFVQIKITQMN